MVAHQAISIDLIMRNLFINLQLAQKAIIILIIIENLLPVDPPQHHMIDSRIAFYPRTSWHPITPLLYPTKAAAQCQDREQPMPQSRAQNG